MKTEADLHTAIFAVVVVATLGFSLIGLPTQDVGGPHGAQGLGSAFVLLGGIVMSGVLLIAGLTSTKGAVTKICYYTGAFLLGYETYVFSMSAVA